ncbi:MAG: HAD family hydrolase [Caldisericia bacterium]|nr:HAD family hydrolase [Caldisericia bacterium]MDD4614246.1 HAD family hydrolase [Caldisericia bacterium]
MESTLKKNIRGFVFDIDGTLLNTLPEIAISVNSVLEKYRLNPHPVEAYRGFVGKGVEHLVQKAFQISTSNTDFKAILADVMEQYTQNIGKYSSLFPGIQELIRSIADKSYPIGVCSNKPQELAEQSVSRFFPHQTIFPVIGASNDHPLKPEPWGLEYISKEWGLPPSEIVFFGDSVVDIHTAKACGTFSAAVSWGFCNPTRLAKHKPDFLFDNVQNILEHFSLAPRSQL